MSAPFATFHCIAAADICEQGGVKCLGHVNATSVKITQWANGFVNMDNFQVNCRIFFVEVSSQLSVLGGLGSPDETGWCP